MNKRFVLCGKQFRIRDHHEATKWKKKKNSSHILESRSTRQIPTNFNRLTIKNSNNMIELDKIYNEDCLIGMQRIPDGTIDLCVTDPPYLIETQGGGIYTHEDKQYVKELNDIKDGFRTEILDELCRVMKRINVYIFCSQKQIIPLTDYFVTKRGCNWNLLSWHKTNPVPACGNKYLTDTEYLLFFRQKGVKLYGNFDTKRTWFNTPLNQADKEKWGHPTIKPLGIVRTLVFNSSEKGQTVLDPFMGSGTTAIACVKEKRHFIGFEKDETYWKKSVERVKNEQRQLTLF